jgi:hypothetical protein
LPAVLNGYENWREEHRLKMFKNRVLRIFGPKRDEVTGEWRQLHNEQSVLAKYYLGDQIKKNKMGRYVACMGKRRGVYRGLVGKLEGKGPCGIPRQRWNGKFDILWTVQCDIFA